MPAPRPALVIVAAMAENRVIGRENRLPWRLPADLRHFKAVTMGKPMLMGRRTWESLPGLLPGRPHLVLTRGSGYHASGCTIVHSIDDALAVARGATEVMVIGGADLYVQTLPLAVRMHLTLVHAHLDGDVSFPDYDQGAWRETVRETHAADRDNAYGCTFLTFERTC